MLHYEVLNCKLSLMAHKCQQLHATAAGWLKKDSKVDMISMICSTVDRKILEHLINCESSKETGIR